MELSADSVAETLTPAVTLSEAQPTSKAILLIESSPVISILPFGEVKSTVSKHASIVILSSISVFIAPIDLVHPVVGSVHDGILPPSLVKTVPAPPIANGVSTAFPAPSSAPYNKSPILPLHPKSTLPVVVIPRAGVVTNVIPLGEIPAFTVASTSVTVPVPGTILLPSIVIV